MKHLIIISFLLSLLLYCGCASSKAISDRIDNDIIYPATRMDVCYWALFCIPNHSSHLIDCRL